MKNPKFKHLSFEHSSKTSPKSSSRFNNSKNQISKTKAETFDAQPKDSSFLLNKISNRSKQSKDNPITADTAATVVRNYILPMFEQDYRNRVAKDRHKTYSRKLSLDASTVYGELKLSEKLHKEKRDQTESIKVLEKKLKEITQSFQIIEKENIELKKQIDDNRINSEFALYENQKLRMEIYRISFFLTFSSNQFKKYQDLYERTKKENEECSKTIHSLYQINDIRLL